MSIAIILSTHGSLSEQLLKTTEMILGKQRNVSWIDFLPEENVETLLKKYNACITTLHITDGLLFLVDMWGGSPFNAAKQLMYEKKNWDIISGVNVPMLIEIFMSREENPSLKKIVQIAIKSGQEAIKNSKQETIKNSNKKQIKDDIINYNYNINKNHRLQKQPITKNTNKHMIIELARIDDRLIHGQIVTRWTKEIKIQRIIVINDEVANDSIRKTLLTQVTPPGITAHVVTISKAIRVYNNPKYSTDHVMLLFTNPTDIVRLIDGGVKIHSVNIGGMAYQIGKKQINNAISIDQKDIDAFKTLHTYGVELEIRKISSDKPLNMMDLIKKIEK